MVGCHRQMKTCRRSGVEYKEVFDKGDRFTSMILYPCIFDTTFDKAHIVKNALDKLSKDTKTEETAHRKMYITLYLHNYDECDLRKIVFMMKNNDVHLFV
jgi:hypothetical protein